MGGSAFTNTLPFLEEMLTGGAQGMTEGAIRAGAIVVGCRGQMRLLFYCSFSFILFKRQLIWNWDGWVRGWRILEILQQAVAKRVAIPKLKSHLNAIEIYVNWWYA